MSHNCLVVDGKVPSDTSKKPRNPEQVFKCSSGIKTCLIEFYFKKSTSEKTKILKPKSSNNYLKCLQMAFFFSFFFLHKSHELAPCYTVGLAISLNYA